MRKKEKIFEIKKTITLSGIIKLQYWSFPKIKLVQEDGYEIDLISRFKEAEDSGGYGNVQVNYWIANEPCTKEEMVEELIHTLVGGIDADFNKYEVQYSEWTSDTNYTSDLRIGGHDLKKELEKQDGKFIILEINFEK